MAKTLHGDGSNGGHVYVYNGNATEVANYQTPTRADLGNLYFHSDLSYLICQASNVITTSVTFPQRDYNSSSSKWGGTSYTVANFHDDYTVATHNLGNIPAIVVMDGAGLTSGRPIQTEGYSTRAISAFITNNEVKIHEESITFQDTLPAITKTFIVYLLEYKTSGSGTIAISATPNNFKAGFGKLDSDNRYIRRDSSPDFYLTNQRTADVSNGAIRVCSPDGSIVYTAGGYNGSFTGTTGTGVSV